ncbi:hypothetical protein [Borrelia sp. A-FGy1]|uniref:hypothetical protein n=1 Tax=Borrelia sp. A-FGy1 TaxID=2608247 RepID=UPI0015F47EE6|nr:hypothetical protein [Borrelia sp. A-FGy1]
MFLLLLLEASFAILAPLLFLEPLLLKTSLSRLFDFVVSLVSFDKEDLLPKPLSSLQLRNSDKRIMPS